MLPFSFHAFKVSNITLKPLCMCVLSWILISFNHLSISAVAKRKLSSTNACQITMAWIALILATLLRLKFTRLFAQNLHHLKGQSFQIQLRIFLKMSRHHQLNTVQDGSSCGRVYKLGELVGFICLSGCTLFYLEVDEQIFRQKFIRLNFLEVNLLELNL